MIIDIFPLWYPKKKKIAGLMALKFALQTQNIYIIA